MTRTIRPTCHVFKALLVAAMLTVCPASFAQGTSGILPDPISSRELSRYARLLDLSD